MGDGCRDALQRGVPPRRPRPSDARRRLRPVVPSLRDGRRDREDRPAHLQAGLRGHGDLVHPGLRHAVAGFKDPSQPSTSTGCGSGSSDADFRTAFERAEVGSWIQLLAHEIVPLGAVAATDLAGPVHTLRHPILSDSAARAFFAGGQAAPAPHALGGSQSGGCAALPAEAGGRRGRGERGRPGGDHPPRLCDGAAPRVRGPAGALDGQPSGLAAAGAGRAERAIRRLHSYQRRASSRPRPSRHW